MTVHRQRLPAIGRDGLQKIHSGLRQWRLRLSHYLTGSVLPDDTACLRSETIGADGTGNPLPATTPALTLRARLLLALLSLYRPGLSVLSWQPLNQQPAKMTADQTPASPIWSPQSRRPVSTPDEAVRLYHFQQAIASAYSSHLIARHPQTGKRTLFLETVNGIGADRANYATGFVLNHNADHALVSLPAAGHIRCRHALLLGGNGAGNYYHWLIEILSQLPWLQALQSQLPAQTVWVLPQACADIPSYRDSLKCIAPELAQKAVFIGPEHRLYADNLYRLNSPSALVFNLRTPELTADYFRFHAPSLQRIRHAVLERLQPQLQQSKPLPKRVLLARRQSLRRLYNQAEVEQCLQRFGVTPVYPETLTFAQQVQLFQQAEIIIGASGAAWSNLLFARPGLKALSWLPERYMAFSAFFSLARYHGCDMQIFPVRAHRPQFIHSSYRVDIAQLQQQLERLL